MRVPPTSMARTMSGSISTEPPAPGKSDVVVKLKACGICGSDLTYIKLGGIHRKPGSGVDTDRP